MTKASDNAFPSILITEGTEPSAPAAGKQRLYIDSTTHKLKRTDSSGTDVTIESSGSGSQLPLDASATAAVGSGDLFGGTSLDGGWSDMQSSAADTKDASIDGYLILGNNSAIGTDGTRGLKRTFSPAGDFTIWARVENLRTDANFKGACIFAGATDPSDGGSGAKIMSWLYGSSGVLEAQFNKFAAATKTLVFDAAASTTGLYEHDVIGGHTFPLWIGLRRVGSNLSFGMSLDGVELKWHATTTTISFTVNTVGVAILHQSAGTASRCIFDYVATSG